jgi:hypothetical protein
MLPVGSLRARVPVGEIVRRPRRRCGVLWRPRRFAIGVSLWWWGEEAEARENVGPWKESWRRRRWCIRV